MRRAVWGRGEWIFDDLSAGEKDPAEGREWQQAPARQAMHTGSSRVKRGNGASLAGKAGSGVKPQSP